MRLNRIAFVATLLSILCLGASFKAWADDYFETYGQPQNNDYIQHRSYIGVFGTSADIDNNDQFNGYNGILYEPVTTSSGSLTNEELDYIPAINRNWGFAGMVGHREGPWALELSYWYSNHTGTIYTDNTSGNPITVTTSAVYTTINIDLKRYFLTTIPTQPFLEVGMNWGFLSSHNTSDLFNPNVTDPSTGQAEFVGTGDQTDSGFGLNLGLGMEIYLGNGFSLVGGAIQRFTTWSQVTGIGKIDETPDQLDNPDDIQGSLEGNGLNFYVGTTVGFDQ